MRGLWLSIAATFFGALFLVPYQAAVQTADRGSVVAAMLLSAAIFNSVVALGYEGRQTFRIDRIGIMSAAVLTVCTVVGNTAIALSLPAIGAGMTSVVLKSQVILIPLLAWLWIKEHLTRSLMFGVVGGLIGVGVMRLSVEGAGPSPGLPWWALLAALSFAAMQVFTRKVIHRIQPAPINALRLWISVAVLLALPNTYGGGGLILTREAWLWAALAGTLGPGVSRLCLMFAVRHVTASFTALVGLGGPLFAFGLGYLVFADVPTMIEGIGAVIILASVAWPILRQVSTTPAVSSSS